MAKSNDDWRTYLTRAQYNVMRNGDTEWPGSSALLHENQPGTFVCMGCRNPLFSSESKFKSNTGWPSFYAPVVPNAVYTEPNEIRDGNRTEVRCAVCDAHLGHVFPDGPAPTGLRYCINGMALVFAGISKDYWLGFASLRPRERVRSILPEWTAYPQVV